MKIIKGRQPTCHNVHYSIRKIGGGGGGGGSIVLFKQSQKLKNKNNLF